MQIEDFSVNDLERMIPVFDAYRQFYGRTSNLKSSQEFLQARLDHKDTRIFIAKSGSDLAGFTQLYFSLSSVSAQKMLIVNDLYVSPQHRRKGVGQALIECALSYAEEHDYPLIKVETQVDNIAAQALYEQVGFVRHIGFHTFFRPMKSKSKWRKRWSGSR